MAENKFTELLDPSGVGSDPFTELLRDGADKLVEQAIHAKLAALMNAFSGDKLEDRRARLVQHGHRPEREVMTGIGPVPVKVPRVRDRGAAEDSLADEDIVRLVLDGTVIKTRLDRKATNISVLAAIGIRGDG